jgi:hypothetical protein
MLIAILGSKLSAKAKEEVFKKKRMFEKASGVGLTS